MCSCVDSGVESAFIATLTQLCADGMSFQHSSLLPAGTPCQLKIVLWDGRRFEVAGRVTHSAYGRGTDIEIRVRFDRLIPLQPNGIASFRSGSVAQCTPGFPSSASQTSPNPSPSPSS